MVSIEPDLRPGEPTEAETKVILAKATVRFGSRAVLPSSLSVSARDEITVDDRVDASRLALVKRNPIVATGDNNGQYCLLAATDRAGANFLLIERRDDEDPYDDSLAVIIAAIGVSRKEG